ncbi:hypothetical protein OIE66_40050 [Nonomuraea sp. NBC_01738]|uniref:hypothetical protein n=1 Tax=Nonomuraea sp. NBC_01738 TaxID=2976003 RepID=UPI002E14E8C7|nr:hypothetical protein OIE66_40050 [Nonomuraea sp. NBC_01738]
MRRVTTITSGLIMATAFLVSAPAASQATTTGCTAAKLNEKQAASTCAEGTTGLQHRVVIRCLRPRGLYGDEGAWVNPGETSIASCNPGDDDYFDTIRSWWTETRPA